MYYIGGFGGSQSHSDLYICLDRSSSKLTEYTFVFVYVRQFVSRMVGQYRTRLQLCHDHQRDTTQLLQVASFPRTNSKKIPECS